MRRPGSAAISAIGDSGRGGLGVVTWAGVLTTVDANSVVAADADTKTMVFVMPDVRAGGAFTCATAICEVVAARSTMFAGGFTAVAAAGAPLTWAGFCRVVVWGGVGSGLVAD